PAGARLLHVAGRERTEGFEDDLRARGFAIEIVETYRADEVVHEPGFISRRLGAAPLWGALAFSERGGQLLARLAERQQFREIFDTTWFFCISAKVAATLAGRRALVADQPSEAAVLALLSSQG